MMGGQSQRNRDISGDDRPLCGEPDGQRVPAYGGRRFPEEAATVDELADIRDSFVTSAQNVIDAGFDGVEIHGANAISVTNSSRLTSTSVTTSTAVNRESVRYPREVVAAVDEATPADVVVVSESHSRRPLMKTTGRPKARTPTRCSSRNCRLLGPTTSTLLNPMRPRQRLATMD
ncbi:hypothetical protein C8039_20125 [Halogeometricum sp. wsp3]|nr:hypothetical protein C8039_20125 [Halogeometricum sp. wsp3]